MACPYFYPVAASPGSPMLPLGDWWQGTCQAPSGASPEAAGGVEGTCPPGSATGCNMGYARGQCHSFPEGPGPDAVRFTISGHAGGAIRIAYVLERDHFPFAQGGLEYSVAAAAFVTPPAGTLARQAQAYVESYLRRKRES